ncbi:hypothetical protein ACWCQL_38245 [Streptomyces sp. NPDC002073]
MSDDTTNQERTGWAATALEAYNREAPALIFAPDQNERVRLGILAAEAYARATRHDPADQRVTDKASAALTIGDLMEDAFHLADSYAVTPETLIAATKELSAAQWPTELKAVCAMATVNAERVAAMLAALCAAAEAYGCDVPEMMADARAFYEVDKAKEKAAQGAATWIKPRCGECMTGNYTPAQPGLLACTNPGCDHLITPSDFVDVDEWKVDNGIVVISDPWL